RGNPRYKRYLAAELRTSVWNLVELYLASLRDRGEAEARRHFDWFRSIVVEPEDEWLFEAMALKARQPKLSYADTIGYTIARRLDRALPADHGHRVCGETRPRSRVRAARRRRRAGTDDGMDAARNPPGGRLCRHIDQPQRTESRVGGDGEEHPALSEPRPRGG